MNLPDNYRNLFPITETFNYLNHAGVAPTSTRVCEAVHRNVLAIARNGVEMELWEENATRCRERFARLVNCTSSEVIFVRNTSHGLALIAEGIPWRPGERIIVSPAVEYPSNVHVWTHVARDRGLIVDEVLPRNGGVDSEAVAAAIRPETRLVAVSSAQYGTGAVTDLASLGALCRERDILFSVDAIQTLGALPMDVRRMNIDFLSADSHKWMLGLMGIGAAYIREDLIPHMRPTTVGWKSMIGGWDFKVSRNQLLPDSGRFEEGTLPYAMVDGFSAALELLEEISIPRIAQRLQTLCDRLATGLEALGCDVSPPPELRHHMICFTHPSITPETLEEKLIQRKIMVSARGGRLRVSPHFYNTETEMDGLVESVRELT